MVMGKGGGGINNPKVENKKLNSIDKEKDIQTIRCFKCGIGAHLSRECRLDYRPCTLSPCMYSWSHSIEGHRVMVEKGRTVVPDKVTTGG